MLLMSLLLAAVALAAVPADAKVYERCELARELLHQHRVPMDQLAVWVCIARHESDFNTTAVGHANGDGSGDHGLFQISDLYWCSRPGGPAKACGMTCDQLEDDHIGDDLECARRVHREHQGLAGNGFSAWAVYPLYCKRPERAAKYLDGCFPGTGNELQPQQSFYGLPPPAITAPPPPAWSRPPRPPPPRPQLRYGRPAAVTAAPARPDARSFFWTWQFPPRRRWF